MIDDDERFLPLTPTERMALEFIRAGKEPPAEGLEAVLKRGWAKRSNGALAVTVAGEKARADDDEARARTRSTQRPRRR
jgi:hypothetical protein